MTTYYVPSSVIAGPDGDATHHGYPHLSRTPHAEYPQALTILEFTSFGDYHGSTVQRSNHRVILADEDMAAVVVRIIGANGFQALGFLGAEDNPPETLVDAITSTRPNPVLDDDDHYALERELESEAWREWGRKEFSQCLMARLDELFPGFDHDITEEGEGDDLTEAHKLIDRVWRAGAYRFCGGLAVTFETGCSVHFHIAEWFAGIRAADVKNAMPLDDDEGRLDDAFLSEAFRIQEGK